ncbi:DUF1707 domain-containing protein [Tessaracoccus lubricantis]|uniref:DUF1707 SHOCT-like domain-containing protein n=1 Tax=Tessaracoccus lubricantis TaxID=545543 RepID=UPI0031ED4CCE
MNDQRLRAGDSDRDHTLTIIQRAYEAGRLDLDEMRERQEKALKSRYTDELPALVVDLPEGSELVARPAHAPAANAPRYEALPATAPGDGGFNVAIMSGRDVLVEPGTREVGCLSFWGGNNYDLTQAMGPGRIVTMTLNSIMGGCNVHVPPGVRVIDQSVALMGGNDIHARAQGDGSNGTVVIKGLQFWGGNDVKLRQ